MSKSILPTAYGQGAIGTKTVRIGWDGAVNTVSTTAKLSLGFLPANAVVKAIRGTLLTAEGAAGNLLVISTTDGGTTNTTLLTIDANGTAGTRTTVPTNVDAAAAVATVGCVLDTAATALELMLMGSAELDAAQAVIDLEVYYGPTIGAEGTGILSL
jgi:hypothetical protein